MEQSFFDTCDLLLLSLLLNPMFNLFTFFLQFGLFLHHQWRLSPFYHDHILRNEEVSEDCDGRWTLWTLLLLFINDDLHGRIFVRPVIFSSLIFITPHFQCCCWWFHEYLRNDQPAGQALAESVRPDSLQGWTSWTATHFQLLTI